MSCEQMSELRSESMDRLLTESEEAQFRQHLAECPECRKADGQARRLLSLLARIGRVAPPPGLESAVRGIWHPALRSLPALRLYPYMKGPLSWDLRRLRLLGHTAGLMLTVAMFLVTLNRFGDFPLNQARIGSPGVYTYLTRATLRAADYGPLAIPLQEDYLLESIRVDTARLNDHTLTRFAETEGWATHEDSFSVITRMNSEGRGAIEGVLHSPRDRKLFRRFGQLLSTAQFDLPAEESGSEARVVWTYSRIFVTS